MLMKRKIASPPVIHHTLSLSLETLISVVGSLIANRQIERSKKASTPLTSVIAEAKDGVRVRVQVCYH
jgi:hypothetical protein